MDCLFNFFLPHRQQGIPFFDQISDKNRKLRTRDIPWTTTRNFGTGNGEKILTTDRKREIILASPPILSNSPETIPIRTISAETKFPFLS